MKHRSLLILGLLAAVALSVVGSGCTTRDPADSSLPWGRPAAWEDKVPGFDY